MRLTLNTGCAYGPTADVELVRAPGAADDVWQWLTGMGANRVIGLDAETNAEHPWSPAYRLRAVQLSDGAMTYVLDVEALGAGLVRSLLRAHLTAHGQFIAHFAANDLRFIERGVPGCFDLDGDRPQLLDLQTELAYFDPRTVVPRVAKEGIDPRIAHDKGLKETSARELSPMLADVERALHDQWRATAPKGHRTGQAALRWGFANTPLDDPMFLAYCALDPLFVARLHYMMAASDKLRGKHEIVSRDWSWQWDIDRMTFRGALVDPEYALWLDAQLVAVQQEQAAMLTSHGVSPSGQGPAVGKAFEALGLVSPKTSPKTGAPSWDREVLGALAEHPNPAAAELARGIKVVRGASKFRAAYVGPMKDAMATDGRVHWRHLAIGATTGRNTASEPAVQQLPKKDTRVRAAFVAPSGWSIVSCDFSQGEPRTMAGLSGDRALKEAILSGDLNSATAAAAYGDAYDPTLGKTAGTPHYLMRQGGKIGFLLKCYGGGVTALSKGLSTPGNPVSVQLAAEINERWSAAYPQLFGLAASLNRQAEVRLESGRVCPLWDRYVVNDAGALVLTDRLSRKGLNYATQGTQRDLLLASWERMRAAGWGRFLWMLVHDEILMCVPNEYAQAAADALQSAMTFEWRGMPFAAEAEINGRSWMPRPDAFTARDLAELVPDE